MPIISYKNYIMLTNGSKLKTIILNASLFYTHEFSDNIKNK